MCTWLCPMMCRTKDITNFYSSLTINNGKSNRYFESPYYPILLNSFYFPIKDLSFSCVSEKCFTIIIIICLAEYSVREYPAGRIFG